MAARFTVTLEDEGLYKKAKIAAVERGVPLKALIADAVREFLDREGQPPISPVEFDWDVYDQWQAEVEKIGKELRDRAEAAAPGGKRRRIARRPPAARSGTAAPSQSRSA
jgi:hypothetical protein